MGRAYEQDQTSEAQNDADNNSGKRAEASWTEPVDEDEP
jgi:hypothetical protein